MESFAGESQKSAVRIFRTTRRRKSIPGNLKLNWIALRGNHITQGRGNSRKKPHEKIGRIFSRGGVEDPPGVVREQTRSRPLRLALCGYADGEKLPTIGRLILNHYHSSSLNLSLHLGVLVY